MVKLIAHRGSSVDAPENTLASITRAIEYNVDFIEIDIQLTKDLVPVVFHDSTIGRTTNGKKNSNISEMNLQDLYSLDAGSWFHKKFTDERIPTLDQVLRLDLHSSNLFIEIKKGIFPADIVAEKIIQSFIRVKNQSMIQKCVIGSFDHEIIEQINKRAPGLKIKGVVDDPVMLLPFLRLKSEHITLSQSIITPFIVRELHMRGLNVWAYTVDETKICKELISMRVDGIITNDPQKIGKILRQK